jgi:large subunit ribosomal protein L29
MAAIRHAQEFREMSEDELIVQLANAHQELFNLRFQLATRKLKNHQRISVVRREVARVLTVARERELQALYNQAMGILAEDYTAPVASATTTAPAAPARRGLFGLGRS